MEGSSILATAISEEASQAEILGIVRRAGSSFYWAMRLLPTPKRNAMFAVYAFCREVDDVADGPMSPADKMRGLDLWQSEIDALYRGVPKHIVTRALAGPILVADAMDQSFASVYFGCGGAASAGAPEI